MDLQLTSELQIRLAAAARDQQMSVEEFLFSAVESALRPIESRRVGAARDIFELEALWRVVGEPSETGPK